MATRSGTVKWFNESKGFGFITPDSVTQDKKGLQASNIRPA